MRFFFLKVLNKPWRGREMPYPKKSVRLPVIWSPDEVASLIAAAPTPFYRTIVMTLYATGMRRAEVAALKITDVDSARMVPPTCAPSNCCSAMPICARRWSTSTREFSEIPFLGPERSIEARFRGRH